ncbi:MAG: acylneuraminate cytidylyltransferase [Vicinamibacteria bacterium]
MSVLAIVPARSGSKSAPHKNVASFRGRPLLAHSVEHGLRAGNVDRVLVSTDSPRYRELALDAGAEVPFLRPAELAQDLSTDLEVFTHALRWLDAHEGYRPDLVVHLRPTAPTRRVADVEAAVDLLASDPQADSVRSVVEAPQTPYKMWRAGADGALCPLIAGPLPESYNLPRQQLPLVYLQNASVDVVRARTIRERGSMTGHRVLPYVMQSLGDVDEWPELARLDLTPPGDGPPTGLTFAFDLDGVIAGLAPGNEYARAEPLPAGVAAVNALHRAGNRIVIYTARGSATGREWTEVTLAQLKRWGVRYHELRFGKPAADFYVDDRMISPATLLAWLASAGTEKGRRTA